MLWSKQLIAVWMCVAMLVFPLPRNARANPVGENVVAGSASFDRSAGTLQITTSDRVIINWQDFSIGAGELTRFLQPSATSAALNRVMSGNPSSILGTLQSNGQVFLINPNGILVGNGAQIDCGSFIASTLDVNNDEFMAGGGLHFLGSQESGAGIRNLGNINALGGDVFMIAKTIENRGTISAPDGVVGLAAGQEVFLAQAGEERLVVQVTAQPTAYSLQPTGVHNAGLIEAAQAELKAHGNLYALAVNNEGVIRATGATRKDGHVILTSEGGVIVSSGTIEATTPGVSRDSGLVTRDGGAVRISGGFVGLGGKVDASGVGAAASGETVTSEQSAVSSGKGGSVTIRADNLSLAGAILAKGGVGAAASGDSSSSAGNGGTVTINVTGKTVETSTSVIDVSGAEGGTILAVAGKQITSSGAYKAVGLGVTSDQSSVISGNGGKIDISAPVVLLSARLDASGAGDGGTVDISADKYFNTGSVLADGGAGDGGAISIQTTARHIETASALVSARGGSEGDGGSIAVSGGANGRVFTSGSYDVSAEGAGRRGGEVQLLGKDVLLVGAKVDASGDAGGGTVLVGGDLHGANPSVLNAQSTSVNGAASIKADAKTAGNGGKVVVWADGHTEFSGNISARGGAISGNGGAVEVSGKETLAFSGFVDASAVNGLAGTLLLDPKNLIIGAAGASLFAYRLEDPNPGAGDAFTGGGVTALSNGNVVASDSSDNFVASNAGAVYLFDPITGVLLGTVFGDQANDYIGSGITVIGANYAIASPNDDNGAIVDAGSVILANGTTGLEIGRVSGDQANDKIGDGIAGVSTITVVGANYAITSRYDDNGAIVDAGSVILANGTTGLEIGRVSGDQANDKIGGGDWIGGITVVGGNYAIRSPFDDNGAIVDAGSVILANGTTGLEIGRVSGDQADDEIGSSGFAVVGANYAIANYFDDNGALVNAGSVILANGSTGLEIGRISGDQANDNIGNGGNTVNNNVDGGITMSGANYAFANPFDDNGALVNAGSVILANGSTGLEIGRISGDQGGDQIGYNGIKLVGGNYAIASYSDDNGAVVDAGSVILANGTTGLEIGRVSGDQTNDQIGKGGITVVGGNYVIASPLDDSGAVVDAGSVILANGTTGLEIGRVSGDQANDQIGSKDGAPFYKGIVVVGGNYAIISYVDDNGAVVDAGSVILASGTTGLEIGRISGDQGGDQIGGGLGEGIGGITVVGANYVIASPLDDNGAVVDAGSVILASGTTGLEIGRISGDQGGDQIGRNGTYYTGVTVVGANYAIACSYDDNGAVVDAGSVMLASGTTGLEIGRISGDQGGDQIGYNGIKLAGGNYAIGSPLDDIGAVVNAGSLYFVLAGATGFTFANAQSQTVTISPDAITGIANGGTAVILQANNDITINSAIISNNAIGNGGNLTLQAGRSILINANITTDSGNLTLVANERTVNGVVDAQRDAGAAVITMAIGTTLNAGGGSITMDLRNGAGLTFNESGDVTLDNLTAAHVLISNGGPTAGSDILRAQASSLITATSAVFGVNGAGGSDHIGGGGAPIRVTVTNLEAGSASGNITFESPTQGVNLGSATLGSLTGVSATGNVSLTAAGAVTQSEEALIGGIATFNTGANAITLNHAANDFTGAVSLNNSGANNVAVTDVSAIILGVSSVGSGTLTVTAVGITQSGAITQAAAAGAVTLNGGAGVITLTQGGNDFTGAVSLTNTGANNVQITDANALTLGALSIGGGDLILFSTGALNLGTGTVGGNLAADSGGGAITETAGGLAVAGTANLNAAAGAITLTDAANDFAGAVSLNNTGANNVQITDANALTLGTLFLATGNLTAISTGSLNLGTGTLATGNLTATSNGGAITETAGGLVVSGTASINAGGAAITLTDAANNFVGAVSLTNTGANHVQITDTDDLTLGALSIAAGNLTVLSGWMLDLGLGTVGGNLVANSSGFAITQTPGGLVVSGTTSINAGADTITLTDAANNFVGAVMLTGGTTQIADANAIDLGASTVSGTLDVTSGGAITDSGVLTITGASSFTTTAGNAAITLNSASAFTGEVSLATDGIGNATLTGVTGNLFLGTSTVGGNLAASSAGVISDSGVLTVTGTSSFTTTAGNSPIVLDDGDAFGGAVSLVTDGAGSAVLTGVTGALDLGTVTVGGNMTISAEGPITDSGILTLSDAASFETLTGNSAITLNSASAFTGVGLQTAGTGNATLTGVTTALDLLSVWVGGNLIVSSAGAITDTGDLVIGGTSSFATTAGNAAIALDHAASAYTGAVSLTPDGVGDATLDGGTAALNLGTVTVGGNLAVSTTAGAITQSGDLTVTGTGSFNAGANAITLNRGGNNFTGAVSLNNTGANNVAVTDANALALGASAVGTGTLTVNAVGITQTGAITQTAAAGAATFNGGAGVITLTQANNFTGAVSVNNSGANNVAVTDVNAVTMGASAVGGDLAVNSFGLVDVTGAVTVSGALTMDTFACGAITDSGGGSLAVTGTTTLAAAGFNIALDNAGNNFSTVAVSGGNNVTLVDAGAISLGASTITGNLTVTSGGNITQTGAVSVGGTGALNAGAADITLGSGNSFGSLALTANNASVTTGSALSLGGMTVNGNLALTTGGNLTQTGALTVTGTTTLNAGGFDVTLNHVSNAFGAGVAVTAYDATITDNGALDLGVSTLGNDLTLNAAGNVTDSGTLSVAGALTVVASGFDVTLNNAGDAFGSVLFNANNVTLVETDSTLFGVSASSIAGNLSATSPGISQSGAAVFVTGTATFNAGVNNITLSDVSNSFGTVLATGNNVTLAESDEVVLGASAAAGDMTLSPGGVGVSQTGAVTVGGNLTVNASGGSVVLDNAANDFGTVTLASPSSATIRDVNALILGSETINGSLDITTNGALTQNGPLTVLGPMTLSVGSVNDITLNDAGNDFNSVVISSGNAATLQDANALSFGDVNLTGNLTTTAGGMVSLTGSGASAVGGNLAVTTTSGGINDSGSGSLTVTGATTLAAGALNDVRLDNAANDFSTVTVSSGNNVILADVGVIDLGAVTAAAELTVTAGGNITDSGTLTAAGDTTLNAGANNITLNEALSTFGTLYLTGGNVAVTENAATDLGGALVSGTLAMTSAGAITQSGALTVAGATTLTAGANDITLGSGNDFGVLSIVSGRNVTINDVNAIDLGASTVSGNVNLTANGAITDSGNLWVAAGTVTVSAGAANDITVDSAGNDFFIVTVASANNVTLADANSVIILDSTIAGSATATVGGGIAVGNSASGAGLPTMNVGGAFDLPTLTVLSTVDGNLFVKAAGAITQSGALTVPGTTTLVAIGGNNITLNNGANDFTGAVAISSANNATLRDANAIDLGASTISGTLNLTSNGAVTQSGAVTVAGATTLAAGAGNDITLGFAANDFATVAITSGRDVLVMDANAIDLGASTVSGTLDVIGSGDITQSGAVTVSGMAHFTAGAGNDITLGSANDFATFFEVVSGRNVAVNDVNAIDLRSSTVSGTLNVTAGGDITDSGTLAVASDATFDAGANNIALDEALSTFGTLYLTGGNVAITENAATDLGGATISGTLDVTSAGAITQAGAMTVAGATTLNAVANDITLGSANDFGTVSIAAGNHVTLNDTGAINLGASTVSGNLVITASGAITDSGALAITGTTTLAAGAANNITLNNANDFGGAVAVVSGNNVTLNDTDAIDFGASTIAGTLSVTVGGGITQSGALNVTGATMLDAAGNDITLGLANQFGALSLMGNNISIVEAGATDLGASTVTGSLSVNSGGDITQSGAMTVAGVAHFSAGSAFDITLSNAANDFGTVEIDPPNNATIRDANAVNFGPTAVDGILTVTAGGAITQSGAIQVGVLAMTSGGPITLNDSANEVSTLGAVDRGGAFELYDRSGGLLISGGIDNGAVGNHVTIQTQGGDLQLAPGVVIAATGDGNDVTLVTNQDFINEAGAGAITTSGTGRYLIYSTDPSFNTTGDLPVDFEEFGVTYPEAPDAANTGSGFLYSGVLSTPPVAAEPVLETDDLNSFVANSSTLATDTVTVGDVVFAPPTVGGTESGTGSTDAAPAPAGEDGDLAASSGNRSGGGDDTNPGGGGNEDGTANPGKGDGKAAAGEKEGEGDKAKEGESEGKAKGGDGKGKKDEKGEGEDKGKEKGDDKKDDKNADDKKDEKDKDKDKAKDVKGDASGGGTGANPVKDDMVLPAGTAAIMGGSGSNPLDGGQIPQSLQQGLDPQVQGDLQSAINSVDW